MFTQASISEVTCAVTMTKLNEFFLHTLVCFILLFKNLGRKVGCLTYQQLGVSNSCC